MSFDEIMLLVKDERKRQDSIYGEQQHSRMEWMRILGNEFMELLDVISDYTYGGKKALKNYIIQIIAVGVAWLEFDNA